MKLIILIAIAFIIVVALIIGAIKLCKDVAKGYWDY